LKSENHRDTLNEKFHLFAEIISEKLSKSLDGATDILNAITKELIAV